MTAGASKTPGSSHRIPDAGSVADGDLSPRVPQTPEGVVVSKLPWDGRKSRKYRNAVPSISVIFCFKGAAQPQTSSQNLRSTLSLRTKS